jgi:ABC-type transporter Mla MlaB component
MDELVRTETKPVFGMCIATALYMVLRIDQSNNSEFVIFTLSGRIENEKIVELQQILSSQQGGQKIAFDLKDVTLVDEQSVEFLAKCLAEGTELRNCPAYLLDWILRVRLANGI